MCDLQIAGVQRFLVTLNAWWNRFGYTLNQDQLRHCNPRCFSKVTDTMKQWQWVPSRWGVWAHPQGWLIDLRTPVEGFSTTMMRHLRESWRCFHFSIWLASKRIDSAVAREAGLQYTEHRSNDLKPLVQNLPADATAVALNKIKPSCYL